MLQALSKQWTPWALINLCTAFSVAYLFIAFLFEGALVSELVIVWLFESLWLAIKVEPIQENQNRLVISCFDHGV